MQGLEVFDDNKTLALSSGMYRQSKIVVMEFDMDTCQFNEIFSEDLESKYFAEGLTLVDDEIF